MKLGLIGDIHGNHRWLSRQLSILSERGVRAIVQLGDLGIWGDPRSDQALVRAIDACPVDFVVVLGNHENYDLVETLPVNEAGIRMFGQAIVLPRVHRMDVDGRSALFVGGAASVDVRWREPGRTWWPQEAISSGDVEEASSGGHADLMFTHEAPFGIPNLESRLVGWPEPAGVLYSQESRERMRSIVDAVQPVVLFHGHHHVLMDSRLGNSRIVGLGRDGGEGNAAILDTRTLDVEFVVDD